MVTLAFTCLICPPRHTNHPLFHIEHTLSYFIKADFFALSSNYKHYGIFPRKQIVWVHKLCPAGKFTSIGIGWINLIILYVFVWVTLYFHIFFLKETYDIIICQKPITSIINQRLASRSIVLKRENTLEKFSAALFHKFLS